ncbi:Uma2 family endonuclease [Hymenobacter sp. BRD128]|uniref:Uma2 family endonuclease n=1 Tax=Hymenobacter sp. BRD128 TaxID=2675878 RepID=UPI001564825E|nr:Uma2 family endonuclease [Hymenobacter sp. BRD128]QKG56853.1 Uma2 family endonuclease [Hymenobacter sp. BRD128]
MPAPTSAHQQLASNFHGVSWNCLRRQPCRVFSVPFDVRPLRGTGNGDAQITTVVQPDISASCDRAKSDKRGCLDAPDWLGIFEEAQ